MSTIRRAAAMTVIAGAMSAGLLAAGNATASAADEHLDTCDLSSKVEQLKKWDANDKYNIIVWKNSAYHAADLKGVVVNDHVTKTECDTVTGEEDEYHWAVFESGEFTRTGDGGYRNWAFYGNFDRVADDRVVFNAR